MEFNPVDTLPFPREKVFLAHRDQLAAIADHLPSVKSITEDSREVDGDIVRLVNLWEGADTDVPAALRSFIKPEMLRWIDRANYDGSRWICEWDIELGFVPEALDVKGHNRFIADGNHTRIEMHGEITVDAKKIPAVPRLLAGKIGDQLEKLAVKIIEPNLHKTNEALAQFLKEQG